MGVYLFENFYGNSERRIKGFTVHSKVSLSQGLRWWDLRNRFSSWFSKWWWLWSVTWMNITEFKSFNDVSNDSIQCWLPSKPKLFIKMTWCAKRKDRVCISLLPKAFYLFLGELEKKIKVLNGSVQDLVHIFGFNSNTYQL